MTAPAIFEPSFDKVLTTEAFVANPYAILKQLQTEEPVYWSDSIGGWIITRYDDVMTTFKLPAFYSNEGRLGRASEYLAADQRAKLSAFEEHYKTKGLLHSDPPDHTRLRKLFLTAFTTATVEGLRPRIQSIVDELLAAGKAKGHMEVISELAFALPVTVLCEILGVPYSDKMKFKKWADDLLSFQGVNRPSEELLLRAQKSLVETREYIIDLIAKARKEPNNGLLSRMVAAEADGGKLTEAEIINTLVTLLVAGHETTTSLIGNGLYLLLSHPQQWQALKANKDKLLIPAIEEILRFESPVARQPRLMKQDAQMRGKTLKKGQMVFQMLNAANRDPAQFDRPDEFDIQREDERHIAFGYGMHYCIGAMLSRIEGQVVFGTIIDRYPDIQLVSQIPAWDGTKPNSRLLKKLEVTL